MGHNTRAAADIQDACRSDIDRSVENFVVHHLGKEHSLGLQTSVLLETGNQGELATLVVFGSIRNILAHLEGNNALYRSHGIWNPVFQHLRGGSQDL